MNPATIALNTALLPIIITSLLTRQRYCMMHTHDLGTFTDFLWILSHLYISQTNKTQPKLRLRVTFPRLYESQGSGVQIKAQMAQKPKALYTAPHNPAWILPLPSTNLKHPSGRPQHHLPPGSLLRDTFIQVSFHCPLPKPPGSPGHPRPAWAGLLPGGSRGTLAILLVISAVSTAKSCS